MTTGTTSVTIGAAAPGHVPQVGPMVAATGLFRDEEIAIAVEVFESAARQPGKDYHGLGAFDDEGALTGFVCFGPTPGTLGTWDLYWIVVHPSAQRQGIGHRLMDAAELAIAGARGRMVVVETSSRPDYGATRGFYVNRGYRRAARIPDYYAPGDDLIVYAKTLFPTTDGKDHG